MKPTQAMAVLAGLLLAVHSLAQGRVLFANVLATPVTWPSGEAIGPGFAKAGLYWTLDLDAVPNPNVAADAFELAIQMTGTLQIPEGAPAVVPIAISPMLAGVYLGGLESLCPCSSCACQGPRDCRRNVMLCRC